MNRVRPLRWSGGRGAFHDRLDVRDRVDVDWPGWAFVVSASGSAVPRIWALPEIRLTFGYVIRVRHAIIWAYSIKSRRRARRLTNPQSLPGGSGSGEASDSQMWPTRARTARAARQRGVRVCSPAASRSRAPRQGGRACSLTHSEPPAVLRPLSLTTRRLTAAITAPVPRGGVGGVRAHVQDAEDRGHDAACARLGNDLVRAGVHPDQAVHGGLQRRHLLPPAARHVRPPHPAAAGLPGRP